MKRWFSLRSRSTKTEKGLLLGANRDRPSGKVTAEGVAEVVAAIRSMEVDFTGRPSCIEAASAARDFFAFVGIDAQCVPVRLHIANRTFRELFRDGRLPKDVSEQRNCGAVAIGTSNVDTDDEWGGHLVTIVDGCWLVDATLDWLTDSEPSLKLRPVIADSGREFVDRGRWSISINEAFVVYERDDANQRYTQAPAYRDAEQRKTRLFYVLGSIGDSGNSEASRLIRTATR